MKQLCANETISAFITSTPSYQQYQPPPYQPNYSQPTSPYVPPGSGNYLFAWDSVNLDIESLTNKFLLSLSLPFVDKTVQPYPAMSSTTYAVPSMHSNPYNSNTVFLKKDLI